MYYYGWEMSSYRTTFSKSDIPYISNNILCLFHKTTYIYQFNFGPAISSTVGMDVSSTILNANKEHVMVDITMETNNTR